MKKFYDLLIVLSINNIHPKHDIDNAPDEYI